MRDVGVDEPIERLHDGEVMIQHLHLRHAPRSLPLLHHQHTAGLAVGPLIGHPRRKVHRTEETPAEFGPHGDAGDAPAILLDVVLHRRDRAEDLGPQVVPVGVVDVGPKTLELVGLLGPGLILPAELTELIADVLQLGLHGECERIAARHAPNDVVDDTRGQQCLDLLSGILAPSRYDWEQENRWGDQGLLAQLQAEIGECRHLLSIGSVSHDDDYGSPLECCFAKPLL
mmetsp:Transcript_47519/g.152652  ORF Transcript_47519/g.152652 Transcript_47519/m.152652 type:complete len:229 (+) Transcript_47519:884-1570(+)